MTLYEVFLIDSTGLGTSLSQKRGALASCLALLSDWVSPNRELFYFDKFLYDWRDVVNCFLENIWDNVNIWKDSQNVKFSTNKKEYNNSN